MVWVSELNSQYGRILGVGYISKRREQGSKLVTMG